MSCYFYLEESTIYQDKYVLRFHSNDSLFPNGARGSYNVLPARLLNLNYIDYLRYVRDRLGAELIGKNAKYITPYFNRTSETKLLVEVLNNRLKLILFDHEHPYIKQEDGNEISDSIPLEHNEDNA